MSQLDFEFEQPPWEQVLDAQALGSSISAARMLALLEQEPEEAAEAALELLEQRDILLDTSDLPRPRLDSKLGQRLHLEQELVRRGRLPEGLEDGDPLRIYLEELAATPCFGDAQVLAEEYRSGREEVAHNLVNLMLSRVVSLACDAVGQGVLLLDLIQEGSLGLWQAVLQYEQGDFEAFCDRFIRRAMAAQIFRQARANGVGQRLRRAMEDYRQVDERLLAELGRNPTLEEIAQELHISPEEAQYVASALEAARNMGRITQPQEQRQEPQEEAMAVEDTTYFRQRAQIGELLSGLDPTDAKIISLRFGLESGKPLSPEDTAAALGLSATEISSREAAAMEKLRSR